jgi:hypothetical protein
MAGKGVQDTDRLLERTEKEHREEEEEKEILPEERVYH